TLATRADEAGIKTTVVSTDRDAFQLVTDNVALMMTPRGVSDVQVYTPERVEARYGIRPEQIPDFMGLKGDTSDNIPGIPGIADSRFALARDDGVIVGQWRDELVPRLRDSEIVAHDYKALPRLTQLPAEDTMIAAYLIEPGRPAYELDDLAAEYGVEALPEPEV